MYALDDDGVDLAQGLLENENKLAISLFSLLSGQPVVNLVRIGITRAF